MSTKHREGKKKRRRKPNKKWFDRDCYIERKEVKWQSHCCTIVTECITNTCSTPCDRRESVLPIHVLPPVIGGRVYCQYMFYPL